MFEAPFSLGTYDKLKAAEIIRALPTLDVDVLRTVIARETAAKNRVTVLRRAEEILEQHAATPPTIPAPDRPSFPPPVVPSPLTANAWPPPTEASAYAATSIGSAAIAAKPWYRRTEVIVAASVVGTLMLIGALVPKGDAPHTVAASVALPTPTSQATTTTERSATTTTAQPTTTVPPTTAAPTTTAPPPPPPPPTTVAPFRAPAPTVPPTTAPPAPDCTPGYDPCIPPGGDVDCAGGSGNGPRYVAGPVYVTGSDPYGLDSNGDGVGCES